MKPPFSVSDTIVYVISDHKYSLIWWTNGYVALADNNNGHNINSFKSYAIPRNWQPVGP